MRDNRDGPEFRRGKDGKNQTIPDYRWRTVWESFLLAVAAANMTELSSGTLTGMPSISKATILPEDLWGVPKSLSVI